MVFGAAAPVAPIVQANNPKAQVQVCARFLKSRVPIFAVGDKLAARVGCYQLPFWTVPLRTGDPGGLKLPGQEKILENPAPDGFVSAHARQA